MNKIIILSFLIIYVFSCSHLPTKTLIVSKNTKQIMIESKLSKYANHYFWDNYHKGNYEKLDSIFYYLQAAYIENPNDLKTVAHLGFANAWAISERGKLESIPPDIVNHATLAVKYFGEAYKLNPKDPRILGFLSDFKIIQGDISEDKKIQMHGFFDGKKSIRQWPEFNYFTLGYLLSSLPHDSKRFKEAIEWQWKTLDNCYCEKIDRKNPSIKKYLNIEATETNLKRKRACWNSWITPHNVEGFFLNMGDMLVKSGDYKTGIKIYQMIKEVPEYNDWPFHNILESRISNAKQNVMKFRQSIQRDKVYNDQDVMMVNTSISCMACHQMSTDEQLKYSNFDIDKYLNERNAYFLK